MPSLSKEELICLRAKDYLVATLGNKGARILTIANRIKGVKERAEYLSAVVQDLEAARQGKPMRAVKTLSERTHTPVPIRQFIEDPYFMDAKGVLYPEVMRCLEEMNSGEYQEAVLTGAIGCTDADTECLTRDGWVRIADYADQKIAQYHLDGTVSFVQPSAYVKYPCEELYHFLTDDLDMALSEEHRVLFLNEKDQPMEMSAKELADLPASTDTKVTIKIPTTFTLGQGTGCLDYTRQELKVLAMIFAAGYFPTTSHCWVRVKGIAQVSKAKEVLTGAKIGYRTQHDANCATTFIFKPPVKPSQNLWRASLDQLQLIAQELKLWMGRMPDIITQSKDLADFIQYVFTATGTRATIAQSSITQSTTTYTITLEKNQSPTIPTTSTTTWGKIKAKDGYKYCFTVPTTYWVARRNGKVFITGNTGKSTMALYSTAYQLYLLSCYKNPHALFGLDPSSEIVFVFQSINAMLAKSVDFDRFRTMISKSPYFKEKFPFDKDLMSELKFPNRIIVKPVSGAETAAIGQNVIGGVIDEMNFMAVVEHSKAAADGGTYDQALALYNSIARRRKSRFMSQGKLPGLLCLVSSKRYPGQFTDKKIEEARKEEELYGKSTIYVYDKRTWDVKPPGSFSGKWFELFIGDSGRKPRILQPGERVPPEDEHLVMTIPEEYRMEFEQDIMNALRDIAGVSTLATHPFIVDRDSIKKAMRDTHIIFSRQSVDFVETRVSIDPSQFLRPDLPRFVHIDLAVTGDSAGLCIGTAMSFKQVQTAHGIELLPDIWIDGVLEVRPPKGGEILFYKIREVIYALKSLGLNIRWVTFDQFQSVDSMQLLRQAGYIVGRQSVDTTTAPYDFVKNALYEGRLSIPRHEKLEYELASLEKDVKRNKIDHPAHSSKDVSDALAGVVYGLTTRREVWAIHNVPLVKIPGSLVDAIKRKDQQAEEEQ